MVQSRTDLDEDDLAWLHLLMAEWQLIADLSFADLLLYAPMRTELGEAPDFLAVAQMRPTTGPTSFQDDVVGRVVHAGRRPLIDAAFAEGRICREGDPEWREGVPIREETIPVRRGERVIAVVARHTNLSTARAPSRLEIAYLQSAAELTQMVAEGRFPLHNANPELSAGPRVGDGLIRLDAEGLVIFASPNALSAYRRLGLTGDLMGSHLGDLTAALVREEGPLDEPVAAALEGRSPREREFAAEDAVVQVRAIPLLPAGQRSGAIVLVRDVSELRLRDRQLLSKDATIREIHHRVKNNLQTVAALLRLQARRLSSPEARAALEESVRRVASIALVHETLSLAHDEVADFDEIADQILAMVGDVAVLEAPVAHRRTGSFGVLSAQVATPLALVLTELLQNAVEHGLGAGGGVIHVDAAVTEGVESRANERSDDSEPPTRLRVVVGDDGAGLPEGFDLEASPRLGLQIVQTLVVGELSGSIHLRAREGGGTEAVLDLPLTGH
jgi:two-component system, sensor histidine kinase PdtaS